MDKPNIVAFRHSFLVIRNSMPKNYLAIKKKIKSQETYKVMVSFMYSPVHRSGRIVLFSSLEGRGRKLEGTSFISLALIIIRMLNPL